MSNFTKLQRQNHGVTLGLCCNLISVLRIMGFICLVACLIGCANKRAVIMQNAPQVQVPPTYRPPKQSNPVQAREIPDTYWNIVSDRCSDEVSLSGDKFTLIISDAETTTVRLAVRFGPSQQRQRQSVGAMRFIFHGSRGSWVARGKSAKVGAVFKMRADDVFLVRVLALLNGGTIDLFLGKIKLLTVAVPTSGERGQDWFECLRSHIL